MTAIDKEAVIQPSDGEGLPTVVDIGKERVQGNGNKNGQSHSFLQ